MNYEDVIGKITDTFENSLFSLGHKYQYHWSLRRWRLEKDEKYLEPIFANFQIRTLRVFPQIVRLRGARSARKMGQKMLKDYRPTSERKKRRLVLYQEYPELLFYLSLVHYLFLAKTYGLDQLAGFDRYYQKATKHLSKLELNKLLFTEDMLRHNPSGSANTSYYLEYLGLKTYENQLFSSFKEFWLDREPKDEIEWQNKIYGLTHIIIAASYFYQRFLKRDSFSWALNFFEEKIDEIIKNTNSDIVAEVGLCFKLCRDEKNPAVLRAKDFVISKFDKKRGYIPKEDSKDSLRKAEHRNIIVLLLLSDYEKLNKGPDLVKFMRERNHSLFLPTKGEFIEGASMK